MDYGAKNIFDSDFIFLTFSSSMFSVDFFFQHFYSGSVAGEFHFYSIRQN